MEFILNNWADIIGILGFVLSLCVVIGTAIQNRCKIKIEISQFINGELGLLLYLSITNFSRLPITITNIQVLLDGDAYNCERLPQAALEITNKTGKTITGKRIYESIPMPIPLMGLGGLNGYFYFSDCQKKIPTPPTIITFQIQSNRKAIFRVKALLNNNALQASIH